MKIPLGKPYIKKDIVMEEIGRVLDRKWISGGPAIGEFEQAVKDYNKDTENEYVAVANATVGLELALEYLEKCYPNKTEVIVPSWSWVASGFCVKRRNLKPIWVDVNEYGVPDPDHVKRLITTNTLAVILVHQMGVPCDLDQFNVFNYSGIPIIEDSACAFGSEYKGNKIGTGKNLKVYSFQARKCLTTGEGGMIVVPKEYGSDGAEWFKSMRAFGTTVSPLKRDTANFLMKEQFDKIGTNYKISDIQAALGLAHLKYFDEEVELREAAGLYYNRQLNQITHMGITPANKIPKYCTRYNWQNFHVLLDDRYDRDKVVDLLRKRNVGCKWDIQAIHLEPALCEKRVILTQTERFHNHGLWLPFFAEITKEEQDVVIKNFVEVLNTNEVLL